ncbi:MAG: helix-turn-helix transcriptional regulator [Clostridia bacterium]|nr:helix-turn-helix transcriptional regulator [Clostridia bacterium]
MLKIQELRNLAGLTQRELAEKIGVKNYTVANWEQNRTEPSIKDLTDLADFFECSIDYLIGRENIFGQIIIMKNLPSEISELFGLYSSLPEDRKKLLLAIAKEFKLLTDKENESTQN